MHLFASTPWWTLPFLVVAILGSMFLQGVRWWMLLAAFIPTISFRKVISCHFAGLFYSIVLPTSAAGDFVRAALISKENSYAVSWGSTWVSRILGILALSLLTIFGLAFLDRQTLPKGFLISLLSTFILLILLIFLSFSKKITKHFRSFVSRLFPARITSVFENIRQGIYVYRHKVGSLVSVLLFTIIIQLMIVGTTSVLIYAITGTFYFLECLAFIPLIEILTMSIPLTPNGLGIREVLLKLMFNYVGLSNEQVGVYILMGFIAITLKLSGGVPVALDLLKNRSKLNTPK